MQLRAVMHQLSSEQLIATASGNAVNCHDSSGGISTYSGEFNLLNSPAIPTFDYYGSLDPLTGMYPGLILKNADTFGSNQYRIVFNFVGSANAYLLVSYNLGTPVVQAVSNITTDNNGNDSCEYIVKLLPPNPQNAGDVLYIGFDMSRTTCQQSVMNTVGVNIQYNTS